MSRRRSWKRWVLLCVAVLAVVVVLVVYVVHFHRWRVTRQRDGWLLQFSYQTFECIHCVGVIERFECNGLPVPTPRLVGNEDERNHLQLRTPVGLLTMDSRDGYWRISGGAREFADFMPESITASELAQGWYPTADEVMEGYGAPPRKKGTPDHWCWVWPRFASPRWLDPMVLDRIDWNPKGAADATSQPVPGGSESEPD